MQAEVEERLRLQGVESAGDVTIIDEQTIIVNGKKKKKKKRKKKKKGNITIINETIMEHSFEIQDFDENEQPKDVAPKLQTAEATKEESKVPSKEHSRRYDNPLKETIPETF